MGQILEIEGAKPIDSGVPDLLLVNIESYLGTISSMTRYLISLVADILAVLVMSVMLLKVFYRSFEPVGLIGQIQKFANYVPIEVLGMLSFLLIGLQTQFFNNGYMYCLLGIVYATCGWNFVTHHQTHPLSTLLNKGGLIIGGEGHNLEF